MQNAFTLIQEKTLSLLRSDLGRQPEYQLGKNTSVTLKIYDITGREVAVLINKHQQKGNYKTTFDGSKYSSGIYIYVLRTEEYLNSKKMMLLK